MCVFSPIFLCTIRNETRILSFSLLSLSPRLLTPICRPDCAVWTVLGCLQRAAHSTVPPATATPHHWLHRTVLGHCTVLLAALYGTLLLPIIVLGHCILHLRACLHRSTAALARLVGKDGVCYGMVSKRGEQKHARSCTPPREIYDLWEHEDVFEFALWREMCERFPPKLCISAVCLIWYDLLPVVLFFIPFRSLIL